jgi:molybdopterin-guanine dinucleotide biosynthesis protein A
MHSAQSVSQIAWGGLLLAGGKSLRMRADKSQLSSEKFDAANLAEHASQQLQSVSNNNFFLAKDNSYCPAEFCFVADGPECTGPLVAVQRFCADCKFDYLMVLPVDMPRIRATHLLALQKYAEQCGAVSLMCQNDAHKNGFPAVIHHSAYEPLMAIDHNKLFTALNEIGAQQVPHDIVASEHQLNLNTPQQWQRSCELSND